MSRSEVWREQPGTWRWRCGLAPCVAGSGAGTRGRAHAELDAHLDTHTRFGYWAAQKITAGRLELGPDGMRITW